MILADTSIVVELLRTRSPRLQSLVVSNSAAICGPTRTEILHATRDPRHRQQLMTALGLFQQISIPDSLLWTRDLDFSQMQKVLPTLRLFQDPP